MERHFATKALEWLDRDPAAAEEIILFRVERELEGRFSPDALHENGTEVATARRIETLRALLSPPGTGFPYVDNYVQMVGQGEAAMLFDMATRCNVASPRVAFLGSGSLDLSTDLLVINGHQRGLPLFVESIDTDPIAIELSLRLLEYKERLGVLPPGRKFVRLADAASLNYARQPGDIDAVEADFVFMAAMLPNHTCRDILTSCSIQQHPVHGVLARDAFGLVGELLYDRRDLSLFEEHGFPLCYGSHPLHQLMNGNVPRLPEVATRTVSPEVVNSTWAGIRVSDVYGDRSYSHQQPS
jgi:hypothetical protein